ncbi:tpr-domain containing protein : Uncharacterized protein OS=Singulisphaera acidiphila (strain ATCC BAA-1392 / DSM 18658 / VKM B-2454 / MOB10) GN=Sinac_0893 PE=4 SV=1: TPR_9: TPR_2 [Gemmata massiliana]|uniref:Tetratricopeptide repeat protein n=1 Tax=Gemmata massiliana TaxID=1210884 RepID=A0A6P2D7D2_9BACT|nr:hypothetical protein [Gemmata massiliana]VTR95402.1 tpr-domain containing protein : Uncharacterized protein OS=Singulisphaera acidiphila (strain ATCC BAA-1392 / DSM 18658 / VKM B-2454 / MOB10) GN=Sinac_0893 PE=4 SV=1: TPR_9: TPR_2 [Gemmata massiliana]
MPSPTFACPKCRGRMSKLNASSEVIACPSCGARVRVVVRARTPEPEPEDEIKEASEEVEDAEYDVPATPRAKKRPRKAKRSKNPWWSWAALVVVVFGGAVLLWAGYRAIPKGGKNGAVDSTAGTPLELQDGGNRPGGGTAPLFTAAEAEPLKMPASDATVPAEFADTVFLLPDNGDMPGHVFSTFDLELGRQALGLVAREDFGLRVRDTSLGDVAPDGLPANRQFRVRRGGQPGPWGVVAGRPGAEHVFWTGQLFKYQITTKPEEHIAYCEPLMRGFFTKCLTGAGLVAKPNRTSDAPVPAAAERALERMRETDQFSAVRVLHEELREKGESDALLAALVRGYSNLSLLTDFHWGPTPYVFKARALLYAQRLVARSPKSALALRARAYAAALTGCHVLALRDLTEAEKLAGTGAPTPAWVEAADYYVHFDLAKFTTARAKADSPLLRLLEFLATEAPETEAVTIRAGRALLEAEPECYLVHDAMCHVGGVSHLHRATLSGSAVLTQQLAARVGGVPDLPAPVRAALGSGGGEPRVYQALRAAGPSDRGEPSWAALGGLLQEIRFTQVANRLSFMADAWGVDPAEEAAGFLPLLDGHRLRPFIESYTFDPRRAPAALRQRLVAQPGELDLRAQPFVRRLAKVDPSAAQHMQFSKHGALYLDEARLVHMFRRDKSGAAVNPYIRQLSETSPHAPIGVALAAAFGTPQPMEKLTETETKYAAHAVVQWGLGKRHMADGRREDALRCWKRLIELSPSGDSFRELAGLYRAAGDETGWRETLEASLKEEDTGLFHAQVRVDLARFYMQKKDFKKAEPYALAAAQSWAGWALVCAAECEEGLGKWDEANQLYEANAVRYQGGAFIWYLACRATGKMNRTAAEAAVHGHLAQFGPGNTPGEQLLAGRFYLLVGDLKTARELVDRANQTEPTDMHLIFAALMADAAGDANARTAALDGFARLPDNKVFLRPIQIAIREWAAKDMAPDEAAVEVAISKLAAHVRGDGEFFCGWYLNNRNLKDRAAALWKRCLESNGTVGLKTHARVNLGASSAKKD